MENKIDKKTLKEIAANEQFQDYYEKAFPVLWEYIYTKAVSNFLQENKGKYYHISDKMFRIKTMHLMMRVIQDVVNRNFSQI